MQLLNKFSTQTIRRFIKILNQTCRKTFNKSPERKLIYSQDKVDLIFNLSYHNVNLSNKEIKKNKRINLNQLLLINQSSNIVCVAINPTIDLKLSKLGYI